jgi:hypothetical protein
MRSGLITFAPEPPAISIMRPSTWAGTPEIIRSGGSPSRSGQLRRTRSWFPPIPPELTSTIGARSSKSPVSSRLLDWPRAQASAASSFPVTPPTAPFELVSESTRWRKRSSTRPRRAASRTRRTNGSITPGPVPHAMWKRGTEFPCPMAP